MFTWYVQIPGICENPRLEVTVKWCSKPENNQLEGLRQKPVQMETIRLEGQNFPEVVAP